jgi:hypothetical protein
MLLVACSPYNPDLGQAPFKCGASEPKCPDDYECVPDPSSAQGVCKAESASPGADGGVIGSDGGNVTCNDDAEIEPNNSTTDPTIIPIPDFGDTYQLINLAICPQADIDVFRRRDLQQRRRRLGTRHTQWQRRIDPAGHARKREQ